jgi:muramoyltetrapeptide carboxypeptidase
MTSGTAGAPEAAIERHAQKPRALRAGDTFAVIAPASTADRDRIDAGIRQLQLLDFRVESPLESAPDDYFAAPIEERRSALLHAIERRDVQALVATRGGYGSNYLLDDLHLPSKVVPKILLGFSDLTSLQIFLWQKHGWVTLYGPMLAAGLDGGPGAPKGYDKPSLLAALCNADGGWTIDLQGEVLVGGIAEGRLLGGCLTLVETTLGTPWQLDARDAILLLEDRGMKPWQVDRALMHLKQAGLLSSLRGVILGDFPECEAPFAGSPSVRDVAGRILRSLAVPVVYGAPVGHTTRPILTLPLGVRARLNTSGRGALEILEPAVTP